VKSQRPPRPRAASSPVERRGRPRQAAVAGSPATSTFRERVVIEGLAPEVDAGRFAAKGTLGDPVRVEADVFTDGHEGVAAALLCRHVADAEWTRTPMTALPNDRWRGQFTPDRLGGYVFAVQGWRDAFGTWAADFAKRVQAGQPLDVDLAIGAALVEEALPRAAASDAPALRAFARALASGGPEGVASAADLELAALMARLPDLTHASVSAERSVFVDRERGRFTSWYELFPRSCAPEPGRHGTFHDAARRLPYVAEMGFDVVYLPPIHPIGRAHRKGPNNALVAGPEDPGSPWAIGGREGGHKAVHPQLGTLDDFDAFVSEAARLGLEVALDIAFQCSPDHPDVAEHPEWFRRRPDGSIQYAENPPKKYQDIYPFDFDSDDAPALWNELLSIFLFWLDHGVRIFRVDNPHTKPFPLWEWLIAEVRKKDPGAIFLSEAFTRPKIMYRLAKLGFTQSYTYFTWRRNAAELQEYFTELTRPPVRDFFRPSLWPNTPDILTDVLQEGGRPAFMARFVLASTLGASYGIYGPAFELGENAPREKSSEEYLASEKYEIRTWDLGRSDSLRPLITRVNAIRRAHPALQRDDTLRFHAADNPNLLCYSKRSLDGADVILVVVTLDPHWTQAGWVQLDLAALGLGEGASFEVEDLLTAARYRWQGARNFVSLDPVVLPAHVFQLRSKEVVL
jgi:starch synthase (maltosyl-transferring)